MVPTRFADCPGEPAYGFDRTIARQAGGSSPKGQVLPARGSRLSAESETDRVEILIAVQISERRGSRELQRLGCGVRASCELALLTNGVTVAEPSGECIVKPSDGSVQATS